MCKNANMLNKLFPLHSKCISEVVMCYLRPVISSSPVFSFLYLLHLHLKHLSWQLKIKMLRNFSDSQFLTTWTWTHPEWLTHPYTKSRLNWNVSKTNCPPTWPSSIISILSTCTRGTVGRVRQFKIEIHRNQRSVGRVVRWSVVIAEESWAQQKFVFSLLC